MGDKMAIFKKGTSTFKKGYLPSMSMPTLMKYVPYYNKATSWDFKGEYDVFFSWKFYIFLSCL